MKNFIKYLGIYLLIIFFQSSMFSAQIQNPPVLTTEQIKQINKNLVFRIEITNFAYASSNIIDTMIEKLNNLAQKIKIVIDKAKEYNVYDKLKIIVLGYSDSDGPYNKKLTASNERAAAVVDFLVKRGFERKVFSHSGRADLDLKDRLNPKNGINRRVLVLFEGLPIPARRVTTGDRIVDEIEEMGFINIRYFEKKENGKELFPNTNNEINIGDSGVVRVTGNVISFIPGDKVFVRVKDIMTPLHVNEDGSFETNIVVYSGKNIVTFIQTRGERNIRRSDVLNIISGVLQSIFQFQLKWDGHGDLDLIVNINDTDDFVYYQNKEFITDDVEIILDVDNRFGYGPENIRVYKAPAKTKIRVYIDYYHIVPFKDEKWFHNLKNNDPVNYTLFVFDRAGKLIQTITGVFRTDEASILFHDKRFIAQFIVN